ncbi:hypothetical protein ACUYGN_15720 [Enterobacter chengduensis]|uniref:hypothetical protein n=1 Tax=Enterobacter TaxID=547 RepID=UPI0006695D39|nr:MULTISPECIES: hypothetical protein [Enterobacter]ELV3043504.1 hypothetical protein [Enterobacter chengduensis]MCK7280697.1 hypothetical protein [Enterobacter chengduensis]MCM7424063.1 hypothetical protein [Enterobacter chengduensis]MDY0424447.1 hypothetical protein [Enterobacter sp. 170250]GFZ53713.1 hypothetical protein ENTKAS01_12370 [Enterobacter sp. AS-1]
MKDKTLEVPSTGLGDHVHTTVKAALGSIPVAGNAAAELFATVIESPFQKRKKEWMHRVAEAIELLKQRGLDENTLKENEKFISAVFYASHLAMKTHQSEKLTALKNAIENVALNIEPDEIVQQMFLNMIDRFTPLHFELLRFFQAPVVRDNLSMGGLSTILFDAYPDLHQHESLVKQIWKELYDHGLVSSDSLSGTMSRQGLAARRTSDLGDMFLNFITQH